LSELLNNNPVMSIVYKKGKGQGAWGMELKTSIWLKRVFFFTAVGGPRSILSERNPPPKKKKRQ
jgi:hypothetical protein